MADPILRSAPESLVVLPVINRKGYVTEAEAASSPHQRTNDRVIRAQVTVKGPDDRPHPRM